MDGLRILTSLLSDWHFTPYWADIIARSVIGITAVLIALVAWFIVNRLIYRVLERIVKRTKAKWDDELLETGLYHRAVWVVPAFIVRILAPTFLAGREGLLETVQTLADIVAIMAITFTLTGFLSFVNGLYNKRTRTKRRPIKGLIQAIQVLIITGAAILMFSTLTHKPVIGLMGGLGAVSAVLMLIFKDPLLGLVSGFQISSNDLVRIGDWIEVPSHGADGEVIDISLLNVTVRNWDNTHVTFPIQALTTGYFKNWRGMDESGGRRVKRSLSIDMSSIRFLRNEELLKLRNMMLLKPYLDMRSVEIEEYNTAIAADRRANPANGRGLTNIGVFRAYAKAYIQSHPKVNPQMTLMVRQLQSGPDGLPLELYFFSADTAWENYEDAQSDIFDHLLAVVQEFDLQIYQRPTGSDFRALDPHNGHLSHFKGVEDSSSHGAS